MRHRPTLLRVIGSVLLLWLAQSAADTRIERLVMPGPLVASHAKYENQCERCHELLSKQAQTRLCRDCHDAIESDIERKQGFHGRIADIDHTDCRQCHSDHKGRDADIVLLDKGTFQHTRTDFELEGAHRQAACESCHKAGKARRDAPHDCHSCHKDDDVHKGKLGDKCADCHDARAWLDAREKFDHAKTRFPLEDKHREVACASCHPAQQYRDIPRDCHACHKLNDAHAGRYGEKCEKCHDQQGWKNVKFDHDKDTKFRLEGQHHEVACDACHSARLYDDKLATDCLSCHRKDDQHAGRNGDKCANCHDTSAWDHIRFKHDVDTKYPLRGRHAQVDCNACHRQGQAPEQAPTQCIGCHESDDRHHGDFGRKCERCHRVESWQVLKFNHDTDTKYPLRGRHATTACQGCHGSEGYARKPGKLCSDCHAEHDPHKGQLGKDCAQCHDESSWRQARFDHDLTGFPLIGMHSTASCASCHASHAYKDAGKQCNDCHHDKDVHQARLGPDCASCHNPNDWKLWQFDHDKRTKYRLEGAHQGLSCVACHTTAVSGRIELPHECHSCHDNDDVHNGAFGKSCTDCHDTRTWKDANVRR